jgi:hypothetical protein
MTTHYIEDQSGGVSLILADDSMPAFIPAHSTPAARVLLWRRDADKDVDTAEVVATGKPGGAFSVPFNPDADRNLLFGTQTYSASNTPNPPTLDLLDWQPFSVIRERDAPTIGLNKPATTDSAEVGITGFTRFARYRRVTVSASPDMSDPLSIAVMDSDDYASKELPRYLVLSRVGGAITLEAGGGLTTEDGSMLTTEAGAILPATVYVTVAHNGGVAWTPESNTLQVTFAAGDGTGGSAGSFDPTPVDSHDLGEL